MQLDDWAANTLANVMADLLAGGRVEVFDGAGVLLAACAFAAPPFSLAKDGAIAAHPFPPAIAENDGAPATFIARDAAGLQVLAGSAGYRDADPPPEMKFKTRLIVKDADVLVESFVFSLALTGEALP